MAADVTKTVDIQVGAPGAEKVPGLFAKIGHEIHGINTAARGGAFHGIETILKGAGVAAFAKFGAEAIGTAAAATKEWEEGTLSVGEAWMKAGEGIPIVGAFVTAIKEGSGALDAFHEKMTGAFEEAKAHTQYMKTKGEMAGADQRFGGALASLGGKAAAIGLDEPEKMRLAARQEWIKTGDEIAQLTKEADLLARKQLSLYFGVFKSGPGAEDRRREYALVSYQLQRERAQIEQMEGFRAAIRTEANKQAADVETQMVSKFYADIAVAAKNAMQGTAKTGFDLMNQLGAKLLDMKNEQARIRDEFMEQNWRDTKEWQQLQQDARDEWEAEQEQHRSRGSDVISHFAPAVEGRFLTGAESRVYDQQAAPAQVTNKMDKQIELQRQTYDKIDELVRVIRDRGEPIILLK